MGRPPLQVFYRTSWFGAWPAGGAGRGPGSAARFMRGELNGAVASFDCAQGRCSLIAEGRGVGHSAHECCTQTDLCVAPSGWRILYVEESMSEEYDYFSRRLPSRTYVSKRFPDNTENGNIGRPMRIANKVVDSAKSVSLVKEGRQTVVYISPEDRQQIKATFYEDDRQISRLSIQKFNTRSGLPAFLAEVHFTFGPEEITRLLKFLRNIEKIPLVDERKFILADDELDKLILSLDQARNLVRNNQSIFSQLLQSDITVSDLLNLTFRKKQLERFNLLLSNPEYFQKEENDLNKKGEAVWQAFFEENQWVFGYGLTFLFLSSLDKKKLEQIVAGADIWGHGKRADALMKTKGAIEALCFVEIKK